MGSQAFRSATIWLPAIAFALAGVGGAAVAVEQWRLRTLARAADAATPDVLDRSFASAVGGECVGCGYERLMLAARAEAVAGMSGSAGGERLAHALGLADRANALRPAAAAPLVLSAALLDRMPGRSEDADARFAQSYVLAPYDREAAAWRLGRAGARWPFLAPATRDAVLEEASWMARLSRTEQVMVADALGDTPAGLAFALRLRGAGVQPVNRPQPGPPIPAPLQTAAPEATAPPAR